MIVALTFSRGGLTELGMFWRHSRATVISRAHNATSDFFLTYARTNARILKQAPGGALLVARDPFPTTTKTATFRTNALMSCINSAGMILNHLLADGHEGNPPTVAGSAWAA